MSKPQANILTPPKCRTCPPKCRTCCERHAESAQPNIVLNRLAKGPKLNQGVRHLDYRVGRMIQLWRPSFRFSEKVDSPMAGKLTQDKRVAKLTTPLGRDV